jgi:hypothetical protein
MQPPRRQLGRGTSFWSYFGRLLLHPRRAWAQLLTDPARLRYGTVAVLIVGAGYALAIGCIAISGGTASPLWLAIPRADYFPWEVLFVAPVTLLCWILSAGVTHLLSKQFHGAGTFDDTLALLGFAVALPTLFSLIPDTVRGVLAVVGVVNRQAWERAVSQPGTFDWLFLWSYMLAYAIGILCLFPIAVATAQTLRLSAAVFVGGVGAVVYIRIYLIFIR